jgi:AraC-like DNA-binding protein
VDAITGLLSGPRAHDAFLLRAELANPWSMRVLDESPLTLLSVLRGEAWVSVVGGTPQQLLPGDVALCCGPEHYDIANAPDTETTYVIHPGQRCALPDGTPLHDLFMRGPRTWGPVDEGETTLLIGTYEQSGEVGRRTLSALPPLLVLKAEDWSGPLLGYLAEEIRRDEPGQTAVLDRLLDLIVIDALRTWFARPEAHPPGWYLAHSDSVVGAALRLMHDDLAEPWSVASLANEVGVSRATLARKFAELVGQPPMAYLTEWRLTMAADLLLDPDLTLSQVAHQVGYSTPFALSAAFKRHRGISPREHRATA